MALHISLPAPLSEEARRVAHRLGISLDELLAAALTAYLASHQIDDVTEALNRVYETESSAIDPVFQKMQFSSIKDEQW